MPEFVSLKVNLADFRAELRALTAKLQGRVVTNAVRAAGRVFRDAARANARNLRGLHTMKHPAQARKDRRPGSLARGIVLARSKNSRRDKVEFYVSVRAKVLRGRTVDPFYWRFLEGGWTPRGPGGRLRGGVRSRALQRQRNAAAGAVTYRYPFLEPAFRARNAAALAAFEERMAQGLAQVQGESR